MWRMYLGSQHVLWLVRLRAHAAFSLTCSSTSHSPLSGRALIVLYSCQIHEKHVRKKKAKDLCVWVLCLHVSAPGACRAFEGQKRASDSLERELHRALNCRVSAENWPRSCSRAASHSSIATKHLSGPFSVWLVQRQVSCSPGWLQTCFVAEDDLALLILLLLPSKPLFPPF